MGDRPMPQQAGVSHRYVSARGVSFHVAEAGPAEAPPVLLLHGFAQHWYAWHKVLPLLATDHRVLCLDLRGCGWSEAPRSGYRSSELVADVLAVLDALELREPVRLIGHECGGWLGFLLCLAAPERVAGYLALNTSHPWRRAERKLPLDAWRFWYTAFWEYPGIGRRVLRHWPGFTRFVLRHWTADPSCWEPEVLEEFVQRVRTPARSRAAEQWLWQFVLHDIPALASGRHRGQRLAVPTLMLCGDRDPVTRPTREVEGIDVRVVPGGHLLPQEAPEAIAEAARELFGRAGRMPGVRVERG
ncbi:alpha/beta fold hydrolase [Kitasatospora sp. LaBMicrA B282]|uniref:alpha/beta fold hydrolase n=1 Tax=Kitasatospora sp. LaBMicrA B282 TaxID=3420949 RepID=UPI003D11271A